jgi:exonuclease V gamma subunit
MARQSQSRDVVHDRNMSGSNNVNYLISNKMTRPSTWRDTLKRMLTGSATTAAANAITNVASAAASYA